MAVAVRCAYPWPSYLNFDLTLGPPRWTLGLPWISLSLFQCDHVKEKSPFLLSSFNLTLLIGFSKMDVWA